MTTLSTTQYNKRINALYNYYTQIGVTENTDKWVTVDLQLVDKPSYIERVMWGLFAYLYNITGVGHNPLEKYKLPEVVARFEKLLNQHAENITQDILERAQFVQQVLGVIRSHKNSSLASLKLINEIPFLLNSSVQSELVTQHREAFEELQKSYFKIGEGRKDFFPELKKIEECACALRGKASTVGLLDLAPDNHRQIIASLSLQDFVALQGTCKKMRAYGFEERLWRQNTASSIPALLPFIDNKPLKRQFCHIYLQLTHGIRCAQPTTCIPQLPSLNHMRIPNYQIAATQEAIFTASSPEKVVLFDSITGKKLGERLFRSDFDLVNILTTPEAVFTVYQQHNGTCYLYEWQKDSVSSRMIAVAIMPIVLYRNMSYEGRVLYVRDGVQIRRWDMVLGKELSCLPVPSGAGVNQTHFFAEKTGVHDRDLRVFHLVTKETKTFDGLGDHTFIAAQGSLLYFQGSNSVHEIVVYDFNSGEHLNTLYGCNGRINTIEIHNGILFALADYDIIAWDLGTGMCIRTISDQQIQGMCYHNGKLYYRDNYDTLHVIDFFK